MMMADRLALFELRSSSMPLCRATPIEKHEIEGLAIEEVQPSSPLPRFHNIVLEPRSTRATREYSLVVDHKDGGRENYAISAESDAFKVSLPRYRLRHEQNSSTGKLKVKGCAGPTALST